jgi:hypothetical protein
LTECNESGYTYSSHTFKREGTLRAEIAPQIGRTQTPYFLARLKKKNLAFSAQHIILFSVRQNAYTNNTKHERGNNMKKNDSQNKPQEKEIVIPADCLDDFKKAMKIGYYKMMKAKGLINQSQLEILLNL